MDTKRTLTLLLLILSLFIFNSCGDKRCCEKSYERTTFSFDQGTYPSDNDLFPEYRIIAGDVLDVFYQINKVLVEKYKITLFDSITVNFIDLPDLNVIQQVLPDGTITLPFIGQISVVDKTPLELEKEIKSKYKKYLKNPELYVLISNFDGRIEQLRKDLNTAPRGLSKLIYVRPDGHATFPLVGELLVSGKTIRQVNEILQSRYQSVLPGMKVDLFLHKSAGAVVYVLGEVKKPGVYEMKKPISIVEALSLAQGYTYKARLESIIVCRRHENKLIAQRVDVQKLLRFEKGSSFFYLKPDDIVFVPKSNIASLAEFMNQIGDIFMFRGFSIGWEGVNLDVGK
jgi:polysaccharide export outer membrane protein